MVSEQGTRTADIIAESFAKGQPYAGRIGLTLFRNQVHEALRKLHSHDAETA
jgi:pyruvate dehydrogenase (quinone)/pyruvate oxidase